MIVREEDIRKRILKEFTRHSKKFDYEDLFDENDVKKVHTIMNRIIKSVLLRNNKYKVVEGKKVINLGICQIYIDPIQQHLADKRKTRYNYKKKFQKEAADKLRSLKRLNTLI